MVGVEAIGDGGGCVDVYASPGRNPRPDQRKVRRRYGIDKGEVKSRWRKKEKEAFVQNASSNKAEDADGIDLKDE